MFYYIFIRIIKLFFIYKIIFFLRPKEKDEYTISNYLNIDLNNINKNRIKIGIYTVGLCNGGRAKITSFLVNYLTEIKIFDIYLYTLANKSKGDYLIPNCTKRIIIKNDLLQKCIINQIDILIYQISDIKEINELNNQKKIKVIYYIHSCFLLWLYRDKFNYFKNLYKAYKKSQYVVSMVPLENDYLFKKWGITSILMNNFISYDYYSVVPSDLSSKTILMIGRAGEKIKRFQLGIKAMKYIMEEISEVKLKIISSNSGLKSIVNLMLKYHLEKNIEFVGYTLTPEKYFKNASLHLFTTLTESFGLVLAETKIYGIPNILLGLDYASISNGGTIIIYDDDPKTIAKESIRILENHRYRKKLGREARKSMKRFNNNLLKIRWVKLILSIYKGDYYYENLRKSGSKLSSKESISLLNNQIKLLKKRLKKYSKLNHHQLENVI